jgi:cell division protein FtsQ
VAAIRYRNNNICKGYRITISRPSAAESTFIDRKGINDLLAAAGAARGESKPILSFDLRHLESALLKNVWIKDAQLFFDNNGVLQVRIVEREPAVRIFTREGNSFYADSSGIQLPLQTRLPARLQVFTGYPSPNLRMHGEDSALTTGILRLTAFIRRDSFWTAQIAQIEITPAKTFELEPEVGDHRITFGDGNEIAAKFHRLFLFYKEVLSQTGMDKYARIDVSYSGQVIGIKKGGEARSDSAQGLENIRQLIRSAQQLQPDTLRQQNIRPLERNTQTEQNLGAYDLVPEAQQTQQTPQTQQAQQTQPKPSTNTTKKNKLKL